MTRSRLQPLDLSAEPATEAPGPPIAPPMLAGSPVSAKPAGAEVDDLGFAENAYAVALGAGLLWAGALTAYTVFDRSGVDRNGGLLGLLVFAGVVALPIAFMLVAAHAIRQGARLAVESRRARAMAGDLIGPAAVAAAGAGDVLEAVRIEIAHATEAATEASRSLTTLREALAAEAAQLTKSGAEANRATGRLTAAFRRERDGLSELAGTLDATAQGVSDAVAQQTRMVAEAADLARARGEEARGEIAAQTAELTAAVDGVAEAATAAGQSLASQSERLERAGAFLGERYRGLEAVLGDRHQAVLTLADRLKAEQEQSAALLEQQRVQLLDAAAEARAGAAALTAAAEEAAARLRAMEGWSDDQTRAVATAARTQQETLRTQAEADLAAIERAVAASREAVETEARRALDRLAAAAEATLASAARRTQETERAAAERLRAELAALEQAASTAETRARETAQAVVAQTIGAMENVAEEAEAAGLRSVGRIESGLAGVRALLAEVEGGLASVERRVSDLPARAQAQADAAIRFTPVPSDAPREAAAPRQESPPPPRRAEPAAPPPPIAVRAAPSAPAITLTAASNGASAREPAYAAPADAAGLRPRLKLTSAGPKDPDPPSVDVPGDEDDEGLILFDRTLKPPSLQPPQAAPRRIQDDWTWKDLLDDAAGEEPARDEESLAEDLRAEIEAMGVDSGALLPTPRIDEIAQALHAGNEGAARDLVSRSATAAIRRLSRRVLTDKVLRAQADQHVKRYAGLVNSAARQDREGHMTAALLASEPGRTYLLLEAAFRELH